MLRTALKGLLVLGLLGVLIPAISAGAGTHAVSPITVVVSHGSAPAPGDPGYPPVR